MSIYGGNQRPGIAPDFAKHLRDAPGVFLIFGSGLPPNGLQIVQVNPRAECFTCSGKNDDAGVRFFDFVERGHQLRDHLRGDGVAFFRSVEGDRGEIIGRFQNECLKFHTGSPLPASAACAYLARISLDRTITLLSLAPSTPGVTPTLTSAANTLSVGILPTRSSPANGQPPRPVRAESKRRQPAAYAARIFPSASSAREWR